MLYEVELFRHILHVNKLVIQSKAAVFNAIKKNSFRTKL